MTIFSPVTDEANAEIEAILRNRIALTGGISFAEYMQLCLYHPEHGYYTRTRPRIGKSGDFFTSSSVHAAFGRLIARQLADMWEKMGRGPFTVAEQGGGEGDLCRDILEAVAEENPAFYAALRYCMVEISPDNRARQMERLENLRNKVVWCQLEDLAGMCGCFLSNELVDAFPVEQVEFRDGCWHQVYVVEQDGKFLEELRPAKSSEFFDYFSWVGIDLAEGNRAEVNLQAPRWMRDIGNLLQRGFVLTIDYGYPAKELYAPWRRNGTLMCYHKHTASEDPFAMPGCQDITTHVDFTALQRAGEDVGLLTLYYGDQGRFLLGLGFVEVLLLLQSRTSDERKAQALRLTLKNLIMPEGGMGDTFKVLIQGKGVPHWPLLCSRRCGDLPMVADLTV